MTKRIFKIQSRLKRLSMANDLAISMMAKTSLLKNTLQMLSAKQGFLYSLLSHIFAVRTCNNAHRDNAFILDRTILNSLSTFFSFFHLSILSLHSLCNASLVGEALSNTKNCILTNVNKIAVVSGVNSK